MADDRVRRTWNEIQAEVVERSEVDTDMLPRLQNYIWVSRFTAMDVQTKLAVRTQSPDWAKLSEEQKQDVLDELMGDMSPMVISRTKAWINPSFVVGYIFQDSEEIRVYAVPSTSDKVGTQSGMRYTISKTSVLPTYAAEALWIDEWIDQVVAEWEDLDGEVNREVRAMEGEREATLAYLRTLPEGYRIVDLIADIEDETHLEAAGAIADDPDPAADGGDEAGGDDEEDETQKAAETAAGNGASEQPATATAGA